jgi:hypothetical protein
MIACNRTNLDAATIGTSCGSAAPPAATTARARYRLQKERQHSAVKIVRRPLGAVWGLVCFSQCGHCTIVLRRVSVIGGVGRHNVGTHGTGQERSGVLGVVGLERGLLLRRRKRLLLPNGSPNPGALHPWLFYRCAAIARWDIPPNAALGVPIRFLTGTGGWWGACDAGGTMWIHFFLSPAPLVHPISAQFSDPRGVCGALAGWRLVAVAAVVWPTELARATNGSTRCNMPAGGAVTWLQKPD